MSMKENAHQMKIDSPALAATSVEQRNRALELIAQALEANAEVIFAANAQDMDAAAAMGVTPQVLKRLKFNDAKLRDVIDGIHQLIGLPDPLGKITLARELDEGLVLRRVSCPIGVIGVIFEARPDALVQISTLCLKSGNCAILKGGKETAHTNRALFDIIKENAVAAGLPESCLLQAESHDEIGELLACDHDVDLLIPRGSNDFVRYIMDNTKIPVLGHADGICHIYVDAKADQDMALPLIIDAKTQYAAACNAVETILVNRTIASEFLPKLAQACADAGVKVRGTQEVAGIIACETMGEDEFATEYLDLILSVKLVEDVEEAIDHINRFGSHHTDCILTSDDAVSERFMQMVDSAGVYRNASTRFADGFRYGFGAEVGISTSKIHARGPVGLEGLVTYKYRLTGEGHIVGDYASGVRAFSHKDIEL
ncbi:Gamma-glutamyl phosphate reductase [Slackia heliotrinireducens]|uniref:Gamma-glutamyl phosphate reductase n=1 Tax=Slackia heliotrinireducens (strain ATCC 29202 / DSM 20476 / NCTC 11029 / RHS 1) TaxID=471855 RepID=C7N7R6_SLAHD|nr:glutamate-5-semialdehyde dehydrogenase [Slackia heliotrinireducens]ACV22951.1 glutamate-5-semialdehyde dehydrogenase [Slackia heliotrinireducens DSM 20476]VEH01795.1 Gamma-glutamyl phosphate reductase [Slackia heliotrinireducens]